MDRITDDEDVQRVRRKVIDDDLTREQFESLFPPQFVDIYGPLFRGDFTLTDDEAFEAELRRLSLSAVFGARAEARREEIGAVAEQREAVDEEVQRAIDRATERLGEENWR